MCSLGSGDQRDCFSPEHLRAGSSWGNYVPSYFFLDDVRVSTHLCLEMFYWISKIKWLSNFPRKRKSSPDLFKITIKGKTFDSFEFLVARYYTLLPTALFCSQAGAENQTLQP